MFSDLNSNHFVRLGKLVGVILFVVSLFLPSVTTGYALSRADYFFSSDAYHGWACAAWTLWGTVGVIPSIFGANAPDGPSLFFIVSGWITPLVLVFGLFLGSRKARRRMAKVLPFLLVAPFLFFASPQSGWGPGPFRPLIGHYVWTLGCLLIFTPQYAGMLGITREEADETPEEN